MWVKYSTRWPWSLLLSKVWRMTSLSSNSIFFSKLLFLLYFGFFFDDFHVKIIWGGFGRTNVKVLDGASIAVVLNLFVRWTLNVKNGLQGPVNGPNRPIYRCYLWFIIAPLWPTLTPRTYPRIPWVTWTPGWEPMLYRYSNMYIMTQTKSQLGLLYFTKCKKMFCNCR